MAAAILLTVFAWLGIMIGAFTAPSRMLSPRLAAAGGGLLTGVSLFWILPEAAEAQGVLRASLLTAVVWLALLLLDRVFHQRESVGLQAYATPLLIAAALHSFIDGWSVRVLSGDALASITVPLALALHKVPEGIALGLVTRAPKHPTARTVMLCMTAEACTLLGAVLEPLGDRLGAQRFGTSWTTIILAVVGGSFLFLGGHTVTPLRANKKSLIIFLVSFAAIAAAAGVHRHLLFTE